MLGPSADQPLQIGFLFFVLNLCPFISDLKRRISGVSFWTNGTYEQGLEITDCNIGIVRQISLETDLTPRYRFSDSAHLSVENQTKRTDPTSPPNDHLNGP